MGWSRRAIPGHLVGCPKNSLYKILMSIITMIFIKAVFNEKVFGKARSCNLFCCLILVLFNFSFEFLGLEDFVCSFLLCSYRVYFLLQLFLVGCAQMGHL